MLDLAEPAEEQKQVALRYLLFLSRKGLDSGTGECASPIFPDRSMLSLPIPICGAAHRGSKQS